MTNKIKKYCNLFKNRMQALESKKILLMLSGGVDSMMLAYFLLATRDEFKIDFACFHLNHNYRGKDADSDAEFVKKFCDQNNLKSYIKSVDVPKLASEKKLGFELCAREVRLNLAKKIKDKDEFDFIVTAHHLDDSAESILHNFIRGASLKGLTGMEFINGCFIRPFIDFHKSEILELAEYFNVDYREDLSNLDTDFTRNLIRHSIIPEILKINPSFKKTLINSSKNILEDKNYLENQSIKYFKKILIPKSALNFEKMDIIELDLIAFRELDISIKKRIIRLIIEKIKGNLVDVYSSIIEEIINLSGNNITGKHIIFKNIVFEVGRDKMVIAPVLNDEVDSLHIELGINSFNSVKLNVSIIDYNLVSNDEFKSISNNIIILPFSYLESGLILRRRQPGDYIKPERLKGKKKTIKNLFVDLKLSRIEKSRKVLLCSEKEVLWVLGLEKADQKNILNNNKNEKVLLIEVLNL